MWRRGVGMCYNSQMRRLILFLFILLPNTVSAEIVGEPLVLNAGMLIVRGQNIVLWGVDAPDRMQNCRRNNKEWHCGRHAAYALIDKTKDQDVRCADRDLDEFARIQAVCFIGEEDINAWLVKEGWALAYPWHTEDYVDLEIAARDAKKGLWRSQFISPSEWRSGRRLGWTLPVYEDAPEGCDIKGNISSTNIYTYHVPGGRWYDTAKIDSTRGERWFCSEEEAEAAGWTKSDR